MVPMTTSRRSRSLRTGKDMQKQFFRGDGYTTSELVTTVVIVGIISAMALPYGLKTLRREELRASLVDIAGFIQMARRSAMTYSTRCAIEINSNGSFVVNEVDAPTGSNDCIEQSTYQSGRLDLRSRNDDDTIEVQVQPSGEDITFSMNGTALFSDDIEIKVSSDDANGYIYCVLVTSPLGFVKTGSQPPGSSACEYTRSI